MFPEVNFVIGTWSLCSHHIRSLTTPAGGDGPKMIDLLQMREKHLLQDRIELLGPVRHSDVRDVRENWTVADAHTNGFC